MENAPKYTCETGSYQPTVTEKRVQNYVEQNRDNFIEWMSERLERAIKGGNFSAQISKSEDPRFFEGLKQTMEAVGNHFSEMEFVTLVQSGENSGNDAQGKWHDATYCWASVTVGFPETTDYSAHH